MHQRISRRHFLKRSAAAASAVGLSRFTAQSYGSIIGSNSDVRIAVIGFNGRGNTHIDAWQKIKGVRLVALCDADEAVLDKGHARVTKASSPTIWPTTQLNQTEPKMRPSSQPLAEEAPTPKPYKIDKYQDVRKLLDSKQIDAISTATPNHWHALITVWGCQAGKDVYVEKPTSHEIWEGRKAVEAARKYNRIVQAGTQSRSNQKLRQGLDWVQAGNLGKILVARGFCYKRRGTIGKLKGEPTVPRTVDLDLWCGPSPLEKPHRKQFHYDWHWFWETGCGDIGNQGIHQMDIARWALGDAPLAPSVLSVGGRFGYNDDGQTPNTQFTIHNYGHVLLIFEVRGLPTHPGSPKMDEYKGESVGNVIECENGYLAGTTAYDNDGVEIKSFDGKGDWATVGGYEDDHFANFIEAVRSRKVSDLHSDIEQGHTSSALCHTSNISYRLGRKADPDEVKEAVKSDPTALETFERFKAHLATNEIDISIDKVTLGVPLKVDAISERFVGNEQANAMLKRNYRAPFVVPDEV